MKIYPKRLACTEETHKLIVDGCVKAFIYDNPDYPIDKITQEFILNRIAKFYINGGKI